MYQTTLDFLSILFDFFTTVLSYEIISGITLRTVFVYNFILIAIFYIFARRYT